METRHAGYDKMGKRLDKLTPWTKRILIICVAVTLIASMYFGYFGDIVDIVIQTIGGQ